MSGRNGHEVPDLPSLEELDAEAARAAKDGEDWDVSDDELEKEVRRTLYLAMRGEAKATQTSAASCAVRYMAVKAKLPVVYGEGLDE